MLKITIADCENHYVGIYDSKDKEQVVKDALVDLQTNHRWNPTLRFYRQPGPPWAQTPTAIGFLAEPDYVEDDRDYILEHEGTAWVYVTPLQCNKMVEINNI